MSVVTLRNIHPGDLPALFEHQCEPEGNRMAAFPARDWEAFQAHWAMILDNPRILKQAILADGELAGHIVSFGQSGEREVGYWIGRTYWGEGIATQALALFLQQEPTRPLYAHVACHNLASRRVLEKCRFVLQGESRWSPGLVGDPVDEWLLVLNEPAEQFS